ncbi:Ni/Fe-hydrogenase, b-type cytochrome subunit [Carboxydothermus pertinax]|uniref:Ni/Fe-hydrogenase, b-type cytochrome subunit n=1 Tax=Carboxydothermus pertinax TaxID=870242 RepID=A0A1L8CXX3_9THEO|nr:Ni/Fe-hydrogenase, b-type cytochrome subunit [Carboxydothermus pertinax]GAV23786.1 Ni/Fe-hydrogenase, b-type cytochrome subunit [Carboxydothermus pertinax]
MTRKVLRHPLFIRLTHWINMIAITSLIISGFYIHNPLKYNFFSTMDAARKLHFFMMYVVMAGLLARVYYAIATKDYQNIWFRFRDLKNFPALLRYYLFLTDEHPNWGKYNPGQKLVYSGWGILLIIQILTGLALYKPGSFPTLAYIFGGLNIARLIHYLVNWIFVITVAIHLYLDLTEGLGIIRSMFTGYVSVDEEETTVVTKEQLRQTL